MWFVYLSLALQIYFGIHVVKTGRPFVWVLVIILTSVLGCAAYVIIELLPEWLASPNGQNVKSAIGRRIDPEKDLKTAQQELAKLDNVVNRVNLAQEYLKLGRYSEAREYYAHCLSGPHAEDPQIMMGVARAEFGLSHFAETLAILDKIKTANPKLNSPESHLLYARSLQGMGKLPEAILEYEALSSYYPTPEPVCRLAQIHMKQGNKVHADELYRSVVKRSATAGKLFNDVNQEWIKQAKKAVGNN